MKDETGKGKDIQRKGNNPYCKIPEKVRQHGRWILTHHKKILMELC